MNLKIVPNNLAFLMSVFLFLLLHFSHNSSKTNFQKMDQDVNPWVFRLIAEILYSQVLRNSCLAGRNFTVCLRTAFVNATEDYLSYVVHLAPYLSPVVKLPLIALKQNSVSSHNTLDNSL